MARKVLPVGIVIVTSFSLFVLGPQTFNSTEFLGHATMGAMLPSTMAIVNPAVMAKSQNMGAVSGNTPWHFDIVLPSKDPAGLARFADEVNNSQSNMYHHFLTHEQLMQRFGPDRAVEEQVRSYLAAQHFHAVMTGQLLAVSGTVAQVNRLLHTTLTRFQYQHQSYIAPTTPITIPMPLRQMAGFDELYKAMPLTNAIKHNFSTADLVQYVSTKQNPPSGTETSATSDGMTVTAQLLSQGARVPGMAVRYLITATYNGQPDTNASYSSLSGNYQGASSLVDSTLTNADGQFLVDFSLSQQQSVSLDLTVSDGTHQVTVPLPVADFSGPPARVTSTLSLFGVPGEVIAPWNPSSNPVTQVFGGAVLSNETAVHGPADLAVYTLGNVTSISQSDVDHFATTFGLPLPNVTVAYSGPNACTVASCPTYMVPIEEELSLDLQMMETSAPGSNIQIYEAGSLRSALNQVLTQDTAHVFSISYGEGEIPEQQYLSSAQSDWDMLAEEATAEGITITVSAGDSGAFEGAEEGDNQPMLSYPANSPYVSALGGLETSVNPLGQINQDAMWGGNIGSELSNTTLLSFLDMENMIAGGGYSLIEPRPSYQQSFVPSSEGRGNPDVSFPASVVTPGYFAYFSNVPFLFGGTSASAPLFAGWIGDLNLATGQRWGNVNPVLYNLAASQNSPFLPVAYGDNGAYSVTKQRYNPVTGLGPANMGNLLSALQNP
ncbi:MAG: hypothetical protein C7B47_17315 [Sulfobacillus thermosulfidooxidans]|uniref:Peptidase S53 domain-containing protein n=1 Tax=Sulfobacillus thermosulfidooxidans TaxID=28034 RepID=A0A2T2WGK8_SULTH|nr:MAG: hypothetical protein C7B47_17315 [Sulfobacillus thermosulfidooxidans]